ncbi:MAG: LysR family transcriptional regulator [Methylophaga sp.]|jgi:DNA-binding transcriptional LysR family regulator|uniref:LysR family transcriptional regulator n=1 Tax=Methylophaga sp. TaxID=2024840 RepID=UPI000C0C6C10|nr:LysR family transcriptional regulator [Methylophaga sp.]MBL1456340.1 LysR family transcriptional regulator [Methylophaga sp.]
MDRLLSMEIFVAAVELGTFTAVADKFKISPPMVSKHIQSLENRVGTSLLNRTTRQQHLTEAGENYYLKCKDILKQISFIEEDMKTNAIYPGGRLKVSAPVWYGMSTLAPAIAEYLHDYPGVDIELELSDRYVDLVSEGFDIVIRIGQLDDSSMVARKLPDYELVICASQKYIDERGEPKHPDDLVNHECLYFSSWVAQGGWRQLNKQIGRHTLPRITTNNQQVIRHAALRGIGLIMMPVSLLEEDLINGDLIEVLADYKPASKPVNLLFSNRAKTTAKVKTFVDFLSLNLDKTHIT